MKSILRRILRRLLYKLVPYIRSAEQDYDLWLSIKTTAGIGAMGPLSRIHHTTRIVSEDLLIISANVHIGSGCYLNCRGGLIVGSNTNIARNVWIYTVNHDTDSGIPFGPLDIRRSVVIGRNVWIASNVCITPGSVIGDGAIIGMGSVVSGYIPPCTTYATPKATQISSRNLSAYDLNLREGRIGGIDGHLLVPELSKTHLLNSSSYDFFVTGTGRSGTTTLAKLLSAHPEISCTHEKLKPLFQLAVEQLSQNISSDKVSSALSVMLDAGAVSEAHSRIKGESSMRVASFLPLIYEYLPQSKVIAVIRRSHEVVGSMVGRGWYSDQECVQLESHPCIKPSYWSATRLHADAIGEMTKDEWISLGQFGRCCWYWNYWNRLILSHLSLSPTKSRIVLLERLNSKTVNQLYSFLGCNTSFDVAVNTFNSAYHPLYLKDSWSAEDTRLHDKYCTSLMECVYSPSESIFSVDMLDLCSR